MAGRIPPDTDLDACLFGGQAFTWWTERDLVHGIAAGTRITIDPKQGRWTSVPHREAPFLARYLGQERATPQALVDDPDLAPLAKAIPGIRLLDQDPWEAFLSFLITPVNNVPRIQETIARLCRQMGPAVQGGHAMPRPQDIAQSSEQELRDIGLGFRAPRVLAAAERVADGTLEFDELTQAPFQRARERLLKLDGVGPKVAECVLCYALGFDEAFPVDRWVARASKILLGSELSPETARDRWGQHAAIAQQVLFHGARMGHVDGIEESTVARFTDWRSLVGVPEKRPPKPS